MIFTGASPIISPPRIDRNKELVSVRRDRTESIYQKIERQKAIPFLLRVQGLLQALHPFPLLLSLHSISLRRKRNFFSLENLHITI